jgi:hypothetical protein
MRQREVNTAYVFIPPFVLFFQEQVFQEQDKNFKNGYRIQTRERREKESEREKEQGAVFVFSIVLGSVR